MKNIILLILFSQAFSISFGQTISAEKVNAFSLEIGKVGVIINIVYDHRIKKKNYGYKINVGSNFSKYQPVFQTGGGFYYLKGNNKNFLELGVDLGYFKYYEVSNDQRGLSLLLVKKYTTTLITNLNIGYQFSSNKNLFKVGISPGIINTGFVLGGYVGFGIKF